MPNEINWLSFGGREVQYGADNLVNIHLVTLSHGRRRKSDRDRKEWPISIAIASIHSCGSPCSPPRSVLSDALILAVLLKHELRRGYSHQCFLWHIVTKRAAFSLENQLWLRRSYGKRRIIWNSVSSSSTSMFVIFCFSGSLWAAPVRSLRSLATSATKMVSAITFCFTLDIKTNQSFLVLAALKRSKFCGFSIQLT